MVNYIFQLLFSKLGFEGNSKHLTTPRHRQIDGTLYHLRTSYG